MTRQSSKQWFKLWKEYSFITRRYYALFFKYSSKWFWFLLSYLLKKKLRWSIAINSVLTPCNATGFYNGNNLILCFFYMFNIKRHILQLKICFVIFVSSLSFLKLKQSFKWKQTKFNFFLHIFAFKHLHIHSSAVKHRLNFIFQQKSIN